MHKYMMRVALLLSGWVRSGDSSTSLMQHIIQPYGADVYCQYWHDGDDHQHHDEASGGVKRKLSFSSPATVEKKKNEITKKN